MNIPLDVLTIVASFLVVPRMKLLDWIPEDKLNKQRLSRNLGRDYNLLYSLDARSDFGELDHVMINPSIGILLHASDLVHHQIIEQGLYMDYDIETDFAEGVEWKLLSMSPLTIHIVEKNIDKIDWFFLSYNPKAIHLLQTNIDKIYWKNLSRNISAIELLRDNYDKIKWDVISSNSSIYEIDIKKHNQNIINKANTIDYYNLCHTIIYDEKHCCVIV